MGCSMVAEEYSAKYVTLAEYAAETGITVGYLRGVIYFLDLALPVVSGILVVDAESRPKLDRIARKIKATMDRDGRRRGRPGRREAAPA